MAPTVPQGPPNRYLFSARSVLRNEKADVHEMFIKPTVFTIVKDARGQDVDRHLYFEASFFLSVAASVAAPFLLLIVGPC